jgi:undecaprenyl-diphosphatase
VPYTTAGNNGVCWVAAGFVVGRPVRVAATVWGTLAANYAVKQLVRRERPAPTEGDPLITMPSSSSFPSSHAAMSTAAAFALSREAPALAPVWIAAAVLMCASRVYVRAHHVGDVVAGVAVGAATGAVSVRI